MRVYENVTAQIDQGDPEQIWRAVVGDEITLESQCPNCGSEIFVVEEAYLRCGDSYAGGCGTLYEIEANRHKRRRAT